MKPSNYGMILSFLEFVADCPYNLDQELLDLYEKILDIAFTMPLKGFNSNIQNKIRAKILSKAAYFIDSTLNNYKVQKDVHSIIR